LLSRLYIPPRSHGYDLAARDLAVRVAVADTAEGLVSKKLRNVKLRNGTVVWFIDDGLGVRGIVNGESETFTDTKGNERTVVPVHQPQTNQNLFVWRENIYRIGEK
jgi:hypothetical protein